MNVAESCATGSLSTRRFHGLDFGKTGQRGAAGTRSALAEPVRRTSGIAAASRRRIVRLSARRLRRSIGLGNRRPRGGTSQGRTWKLAGGAHARLVLALQRLVALQRLRRSSSESVASPHPREASPP